MTFLKMLAGLALLGAPVIASGQSPAVEAARAAAAEYDNEGARAIVTEACDAGDGPACRALLGDLATSYEPADEIAARTLADTLCKRGETLGCVTLARYAESGRGGDADPAVQRDSLATACRSGMASACLQAAYLAEQGTEEVPEPDMALAREMAGKGCAARSGPACTLVGRYLYNRGWESGTDAQQNAAWGQARRAYRQGCDTGDRDSCVGLANMMLEGRGGDIDRTGAATLLEAECARDYYTCDLLLSALKP